MSLNDMFYKGKVTFSITYLVMLSFVNCLYLTLTVTEIHPMTYGQGQGYRFLGHQS